MSEKMIEKVMGALKAGITIKLDKIEINDVELSMSVDYTDADDTTSLQPKMRYSIGELKYSGLAIDADAKVVGKLLKQLFQ